MSETLLFEIGVEEMPSAALYAAVEQLKTDASQALLDARLDFGLLETFGSPRRLVLRVERLGGEQKDLVLEVRGPAVKVAFDAAGDPTSAAKGFAASRGVDVESLVRKSDAGGEYLWASIEEKGRAAKEVLPGLLAMLTEGLSWPKTQRWGDGEARFIRPVRWLLALYGSEVVPVKFAGVIAGRSTQAHRFIGSRRILELTHADEYASIVAEAGIIYDAAERSRIISDGISSLLAAENFRPVMPKRTFAEVVNLVESPTVGLGSFDEEFLQVPREVLESAMTKHQRYFPVESSDGRLVNRFLVVHNGDPSLTDQIVHGHERVIRARLADASFFFSEDLAFSNEARVAKLSRSVFHEKLGTLGDKVNRIELLVKKLAVLHGADEIEAADALRAAHLAKADLVSQVVIEFPDLQGVMGYHYALAAGETSGVALAIRAHYQPRFANDVLPSTAAGMLVSAADKLDTLAGIFAIGQGPTGSSDPYALRRGAIGVLTMLLTGNLRIPLDEAIASALAGYGKLLPGLDADATQSHIGEFVAGRLEIMLRDRNHAYDTVAAVLAVAASDPADALARCEALTAARAAGAETFENLSVAFTRAKNLSKPELGTECQVHLMTAEERSLADALTSAEAKATEAFISRDYKAVLETLSSLREPIDVFFDSVLVMDPDEALRNNRLKLLNRFVALFLRFADLSRLAG